MEANPTALYQVSYRLYYRPFCQPLHTHHGLWRERQGIIVRLTAGDGRSGWGEIAPLPWFGSETLEQAIAFCQGLNGHISSEQLWLISGQLPACQFGFGAAWEDLLGPASPPAPAVISSALLPTGSAALTAWANLWQQGHRTFKWKIGVAPIEQELEAFGQLMHMLPATARLRLDANGGLTPDQAQQWLEQGDRHACRLEFIEQPLPPGQEDTMQQLSQQFLTPVALDESVATLAQLRACYRQGWRGVVVIKAAIAGFPWQLRQFCQTEGVDPVWSSVFETGIGRQFIYTRLLPSGWGQPTSPQKRAAGFGIDHWFSDSTFNHSNREQLWERLRQTL